MVVDDGARQEVKEYLNLKIMPFTKVGPQVVFQVISGNDIPAVMTWDNDFHHFGRFTGILERR